MEPANLYQNPRGEPPEIRRWYVHRLNQYVKV